MLSLDLSSEGLYFKTNIILISGVQLSPIINLYFLFFHFKEKLIVYCYRLTFSSPEIPQNNFTSKLLSVQA